MKLTDGEKLILMMLAELFMHLKIKDGIDPALVARAISDGQPWALKAEYSAFLGGEDTEESIVEETGKIMSMWSFIESSWTRSEWRRRPHHSARILNSRALMVTAPKGTMELHCSTSRRLGDFQNSQIAG